MRRRNFIQTIGAGFAAALVLSQADTRALDALPQHAPETRGIDTDGCRYVYTQALRSARAGDFIMTRDGRPLGVAMQPMRARAWGWVQVYGPATVNLA